MGERTTTWGAELLARVSDCGSKHTHLQGCVCCADVHAGWFPDQMLSPQIKMRSSP